MRRQPDLLSSRNEFHLNFLVRLIDKVRLDSHRLMVVLQLVRLEDLDGDNEHLQLSEPHPNTLPRSVAERNVSEGMSLVVVGTAS